MKTDKSAELDPSGDRDNTGVLVGRDWQGEPIYRKTVDKAVVTESPNDRDKGGKAK